MDRYEVWLASVRFAEKPVRKNRPVIIRNWDDSGYSAIFVTTHPPRDVPGEYQLIYYKEAGLDNPSVARCSRILDLYEDDLICKFGKLHRADILGVELALSQLTRKP